MKLAMRTLFRALLLSTASITTLGAMAANEAVPPLKITMEEFMVPSGDAGIDLYVRNKHPQGVNAYANEKILLYVHGSTYPSETAFDLQLNGMSWMDYIASHGYDVYLVDLRGYGKSTRPPEMSQPADMNPPIVRTEQAAKDVSAAVNFILKRRGAFKLNLLGWSWGTSIMGLYTTQNNDKVTSVPTFVRRYAVTI